MRSVAGVARAAVRDGGVTAVPQDITGVPRA